MHIALVDTTVAEALLNWTHGISEMFNSSNSSDLAFDDERAGCLREVRKLGQPAHVNFPKRNHATDCIEDHQRAWRQHFVQ